MKYFLFTAVVCISIANAQDDRKWNAYVGAGPSFGMGDFGDRVNTGWDLNGGGGYNFTKNLSLNIDYLYTLSLIHI